MTARVDEIADGIFRISVAGQGAGGAFTYNQFLIRDEAPMLVHALHRRLFETTRAAIARVLPPQNLRYIGFSHFEADESGALNEYLALAPRAEAVCGRIAAMVSINDYALRPAKAMQDGEALALGRRTLEWLDAPHMPHGWENGFFLEREGGTLFCSDLFTQAGGDHPPVTEGDVLGPSEALRARLDYYAHAKNTRAILARLGAKKPKLMACMHGSAWRGDGAALLAALADRLGD